jgi:hypothetical protein
MDTALWPAYDGPGDLAEIEAVPLADRGLPGTTYEIVLRAARLWPRPALRAEATREAPAEALRDVPGVAGVRGLVEDGAVVLVVEMTDGSDELPVKETLDRFAITWRMEKS